MRAAFIRTLAALAERDPRILLLTGDLGYKAIEPFSEKFPARFVNVGIAEQNLIGLATGLAESGFIPFVYSIVPFAALRPYEFIRNGPIQHQLPVRIVGTGGGFEYGTNGLSHYGLEDIGVMRIQPGIAVIAPADFQQAATALQASWDLPGPIYYRLGKDDQTVVPGLNGQFALDQVQRMGSGRDLLLISMGSVTVEAEQAVRILEKQGIACTLAIVASLSAGAAGDLAAILSTFRVAITVEAHYRVGGVGSMAAEVIAERALRCRLVRCGVASIPDGISGSQHYLHTKHGISCEALAATALRVVREKTP